jgi:hypothetical protein
MNPAIAVFLALIFASSQALACRCAGEDFFISRLKEEGLAALGQEVYFGRVINWYNSQEAEVLPLEVYRGKGGVRLLRAHRGHGGSCAGHFSRDEEFVYFPDKDGYIDLCTKRRATQRLLEALRTASRQPKK